MRFKKNTEYEEYDDQYQGIDVNHTQTYLPKTFDTNIYFNVAKNYLLKCIFQKYLNTTLFGTNNLLNTSRRFQPIKEEKFYWKLNKEYSLKFFLTNSNRFKTKLNALHIDSKSQLSLKFPQFTFITDVSQLQDMHAIDINGSLKLLGVSALRNVHSLNLKNSIGVSDDPNHVFIRDGFQQMN